MEARDPDGAPLLAPSRVLGHVVGFVGGSLAVFLGVILVFTLLVAVRVPLGSPEFAAALDRAVEAPGIIGPATLLQMVGLGGLAFALGAALPRRRGETLGQALGLRSAGGVLLATAFVGGLLVWIWPSWFAARLIEWTGLDSSIVSIGELLAGPLGEIWPMVLAVVVGAPLSEELLFRGYLWRLVESASGSREVALGLTTALFALYHMDPVHVVALLPTSAFLGWMRYVSGSVWPSLLAHFANNAAAVVVVQVIPGDTLGTAASYAGAAAFLAVVGGGTWLSRRASAGPASPTRP